MGILVSRQEQVTILYYLAQNPPPLKKSNVILLVWHQVADNGCTEVNLFTFISQGAYLALASAWYAVCDEYIFSYKATVNPGGALVANISQLLLR